MKDEKVQAMREFILLLTKQVKDAQIEASIKTMLDKLIAEKMAEIEAAVLAQGEPYDKTEMNAFVQNLYDQKMREGKHGHYETMFHVVHQAIKRAHPATVNTALLERIKELEQALDAALEALEEIHPGNMTPMAEDNWNAAIEKLKEVRRD